VRQHNAEEAETVAAVRRYDTDDEDTSNEGEDETQRIISHPVFVDPEFVNNSQFLSFGGKIELYTSIIFPSKRI